MLDNFVHIMTTAASGCIVALFAHWLRNRYAIATIRKNRRL
ncbi:type I toxin-antitoxin system Fst family toxin [Staphylococcus epidermidis]|nr:type I toxin-antitoxin system Fst family toxin [Staphylococcus epidermidis]